MADAAAILLTVAGGAFLLLVTLGLMREIEILRSQVTALTQLVITPVGPSYIGESLPKRLADELTTVPLGEEDFFVLFVSSQCVACDQFLRDWKDTLPPTHRELPVVVVVADIADEASRFMKQVKRVASIVVLDPGQHIMRDCEIQATPGVLTVEAKTRRVREFAPGATFLAKVQSLGGEEPPKVHFTAR